MQLKKAGGRLLAGIALLLAAGAAVSLWSLEKVGRLSSEAAQEGRKIERLLMTGAKVQTDFQVQIQEFKNVLLRGEDAGLYKKHLDGFKQRREAVQAGLDEMSQVLEQAGMDKTPAEQLLLVHSELSFRYGEAAKLVRGMGIAAAAEADKSVRGIDRDTSKGLSELRAAIDTFAAQRAEERAAEIAATTTTARQLMVAVTLLGGLAVLLSVHVGLRRLLRLIGGEPSSAVAVFARIATGDLSTPIPNAEVDGSLMAELARMQQQLRQRTEAEQQAAAETLRIKRALDNAGACMMLVGCEGRVVYANQAMQALLAERAAVLGCVAQPLAGQDFAGLLAQTPAAAWAASLGGADDPGACDLDVAGVTLALLAKGVFADDGQRIGTVVEWQDHTAGVQAERQIEALIEAVLRGDFSHRVPLQGKQGFYLKSAEGLNNLAGVMAEVVSEVGGVLNALSGGDLTQKIAADYQGRLGQLKNDANATVDRLREIVSQLQRTTETINAAAGDIATGNADISRSTEAQASALEETSSSMEELNSTVRQNAENARQANQLAVHANEAASAGGQRMAAMVATMSDIQQASQRIEAIIGVIDAIAFQTNILALNAAVEAARAGEQGRGFAVVAAEVRNLAKRSAEAAREIKGLITDSVGKVGAGVTLVEQFGRTMQEIVVDFQRLSALVTDIADASSEQSSGIDQVTRAVTEMDTAMQQNAARVEEAAAAAVMLTGQSAELARMVSSFRIEGWAPLLPAPSGQRAPARQPAAAALPALEDEWTVF